MVGKEAVVQWWWAGRQWCRGGGQGDSCVVVVGRGTVAVLGKGTVVVGRGTVVLGSGTVVLGRGTVVVCAGQWWWAVVQWW